MGEASSKNLLKQFGENPEKIYIKLETIKKTNEYVNDLIGINGSDSFLMVNKKGKWKYNYNGQIVGGSQKNNCCIVHKK